MSENRFQMAGWLAITAAVLFPLGFIIKIGQGLIGVARFHYQGPTFGPGDIVLLVYTGFIVYVFVMFRKFLNERYSYHDLDTLIVINIWWCILYMMGQYVLWGFLVIAPPVSELAVGLTYLVYTAVSMVIIGIIDIFIAVKLLKVKETLSDLLKAFAVVTLAAGICELTVILTPIALLLVPVSCVILGMVLLRSEEELEFV